MRKFLTKHAVLTAAIQLREEEFPVFLEAGA